MKAKFSKSTGGIYPVSAFKIFPDDAKDIPDALYIKFQDAEISRLDVVNGEVVEFASAPPTTDELKQLKVAEINAAFEQDMQPIINGIPAIERESWRKQEEEARAYVANNAAFTPLIDALASSRSVNKAELVTRIIQKADLFAGISGTLIGRRQGLEDTLDALPPTATAEEIEAIVW